jgi:peptide/nickel transport system ATP-binding protein
MPVLAISDLKVDIHGNTVLHDIDLTLEPGRILGVVGESGSGKSMTALSVMQLLPHGSRWSGSIRWRAPISLASTNRHSAGCAAAMSA